MTIPKEFTIGGGRRVQVNMKDTIDDNYGFFNSATCNIDVAKNICIDGIKYEITEEDKERTFYHELFHAFEWFYNCEMNESLAQTFSNFLYEFMHSKQ